MLLRRVIEPSHLAQWGYKELHPVARAVPRLVGHRGLLRHAPENTLAGFGACIDLRLGFELDVRRSSNTSLCVRKHTGANTGAGGFCLFRERAPD